MKPNFFSRLLEVAKSTKISKIEDYTTEILCRAIQDDLIPFQNIIEKIGILSPCEEIIKITPYTQFPIGNGRIDLILQIETQNEEIDLLFEIKVNSPESGNQLDKYVDFVKRCKRRTILLSIGKDVLRKDIPVIFWQQIWDSISETKTCSVCWLELSKFLKDIFMADEFNKPISVCEVKSFSDTFVLLQKSWHILQPVSIYINNLCPHALFPTARDKILEMASSQFIHNRFILYSNFNNAKAYLMFGFAFYDQELNLAVWIETDNPRHQWIREALIDKANQLCLSDDWSRIKDLKRWEVLLVKEAIKNDMAITECSKWFTKKIDQLKDKGFFEFIYNLKKA